MLALTGGELAVLITAVGSAVAAVFGAVAAFGNARRTGQLEAKKADREAMNELVRLLRQEVSDCHEGRKKERAEMQDEIDEQGREIARLRKRVAELEAAR